ncbi:MAG TPA: hypothetical protein VJU13_08455 [Candidatus Nitrosocosmicus sp.]|nr:hypothetical protein [Candidatus Nitrosocosmicus sp.]
MTTILASLQNSLLVVDSSKDGWKVQEHLKGLNPNSLALDSKNSRAYCGTFDNGLWKTDDNGHTWDETSLKTSGYNIMSLATSPMEKGEKGFDKLFVGMEPSIIYSSIDGGATWKKIDEFNKLPSASTWSFPPRPWTHHVRWIETDVNNKEYIFAAIEAGALIKSNDGGKSWIDKVKDGPYDTHTLRTHKKAPQRLYSAAGDGYFESTDYGNTWYSTNKGLGNHTYLYGIAVNSDNPHNIIVSAASNAWKSHAIQDLETFVYRRDSSIENQVWTLSDDGLPESKGTVISILQANPRIKDEFYCLNNRGLYCSKDSAISWNKLDIHWSKEYCLQHPWALAISE